MSYEQELLKEADAAIAAETPEITTPVETPIEVSNETPTEVSEVQTETHESGEVKREWYEDEAPTEAVIETPTEAVKPVEKDPVYDNPIVQEVINLVKGNADPKQILEILGGEDPKRKTTEELFEIKLNALGMSEEEKEEARAEFETYSAYKKKEITLPVLHQLDSDRQKKLDQLTEGRRATEQQALIAHQKIAQEVESLTSGYVGKELYGLTVTPEVANKAKQDFLNTNLRKADGSLDTERILNLLLLERNIKQIVKTNVQRGKNESLGQVVNNLTNPSLNTTARTPVVAGKESVEEEANRILENRMKAQGIKF